MNIPLSPFAPENLVSRDGFGSPVPRQPAHLHSQAEAVWCLLTGFLPSSTASIYLFKPPYAIGSVPSLSGHAVAYRWRSLPRVSRHRAIKPQGISKRVLPWHVTMNQLIYASLSHTHYWYEVGMLKILADIVPGMKFHLRVGCFWGIIPVYKTSNSCLRAGFVVFSGSSQGTCLVCTGPY